MTADVETRFATPLPPKEQALQPLLEVQDLIKHYPIHGGLLNRVQAVVKAVDGVNLTVYAGQTLGIVGESGCGKSTLARSIIRLEEPTSGQIQFDGQDWLALKGSQLRQKRADMQMVFQNPYASLNPRMTVEQAIAEPLDIFRRAQGRDKQARVQALMNMVGLSSGLLHRMPSELSGGQRQRVCIARALALNPNVSVQAQVLNLMDELKRELGLTYIFIAHNLGVVEHFCDEVAVMYLGKIVEQAPVQDLFASPKHPYTQALLAAAPVADPLKARNLKQQRVRLSGELPNPMHVPPGCAFHTRCPQAMSHCSQQFTPTFTMETAPSPNHVNHTVACHLYAE
jgi:oligopeptide/dipeptide ABC transporter ATP-binding protein